MSGPMVSYSLSTATEVRGTPRDVWPVLGDFEDVEVWAPALTDAYRTTGPDVGVGSRRSVRYRHILTMEQVITAWQDGESLTYAVFRAPWPLRNFSETWSVEPTPGGAMVRTRVEYEVRFSAVGRFVNWVFTRHVLRFEMRRGQRGLKDTVEGRVRAGAGASEP